MGEMKDPSQFLRASILAQSIIACLYMTYGMLMYSFQGQYIANPSQQGISPYGWQTAGNILGIVTSVISCTIYANVGIRVLYVCFLEEAWQVAPNMHTRKGTVIWGMLAIVYWTIAWVLAEGMISQQLPTVTVECLIANMNVSFLSAQPSLSSQHSAPSHRR